MVSVSAVHIFANITFQNKNNTLLALVLQWGKKWYFRCIFLLNSLSIRECENINWITHVGIYISSVVAKIFEDFIFTSLGSYTSKKWFHISTILNWDNTLHSLQMETGWLSHEHMYQCNSKCFPKIFIWYWRISTWE